MIGVSAFPTRSPEPSWHPFRPQLHAHAWWTQPWRYRGRLSQWSLDSRYSRSKHSKPRTKWIDTKGKLQASHGQTIRSWLKFGKKHGWLMPKPQGQNAHSFGIEGAIAISESGAWDTLTQVRVGHSIVTGVPILRKTWNHESGMMSLVQTWAAEVKVVYFLHAAAWNIWKAVSLKFKHFGTYHNKPSTPLTRSTVC